MPKEKPNKNQTIKNKSNSKKILIMIIFSEVDEKVIFLTNLLNWQKGYV